MDGSVLVALVAAIGNLLQGWDNATIAGAVLYIKREFMLESEPTMEGLVVATSLIGATIITTFSGAASDCLGRRPMLMLSSLLYFIGGILMLWSSSVYMLLLGRLVDGFGVGLAATLVPIYISEIAPSDIRGSLNTLPQFTGSGGMFFSYCMVFGMSLLPKPDWRLMLGVVSIPFLLYLLLIVFFLPESPRWLVSKGRMVEAKHVLQRLRGREDVSGEMALLVEGLGVGVDTSIQEYIICPPPEFEEEQRVDKDTIKLYGPEAGISWVARPVKGQSALAVVSRHGSTENQRNVPFMDPLVNLFGSVHENTPEMGSMRGSMRSTLFPNFGSMFNVQEQPRTDQWDEESVQLEGEDHDYEAGDGDDSDDNLHSPLLSRQTTSMEGKDMVPTQHNASILNIRRDSNVAQGNAGNTVGSTGIGGGWQLAWKWTEEEGAEGRKMEGLQRIYLHEEGVHGSRRGSLMSLAGGESVGPEGEYVRAAALVSHSALYSKDLLGQHPFGPAMVHPSKTAVRGPQWKDLLEPGVKHALLVGVGIQMLQQFAGINGVLFYTPQILEQAGVEVLLANLGIGSDSASILVSSFTTLLMLPSIAFAMRLMDVSGRRRLMLLTIPILTVSLVVLVISNVVPMGSILHAMLSTVSLIIYFCCFVMGLGPVPNILCSEIFPTRVRGVCIAICALTFWICNIIVTYSLPLLLNSIGLAGVFGTYAIICVLAFIFVFLKVPETKGMPLEVITEIFAVGAKQMQKGG